MTACRAPLEHTLISCERFVLLAPLGHPFASRHAVDMIDLPTSPS